ncbi:CRISPR-associated helicase/endonuclease Cas3 [Desulfofundulus thermosubterraneus]|uniref:CRISPR-associated helicase Cas3/CRISPR-associated endonuclease Cas3-HD n=1 Tax=Desulfofundulus thermosubterraneus DSM 16057 TaxID=1121432 RepID=A0A1M6MF87_9FIRM|nr:CRISPR-associated helicase/endonuclease Cas3 [Desulfofundulus thermosubterraneus]SHJ82020.1 CRISPR-associated helicase Cas3/CRISPR-associated endonuclease Cas3-HD [Desulfofundulus thermosubterraneus DSM 16057]
MSVVKAYPLSECIARPKGPGGEDYPLVDHLLAVANGMGNPQEDIYDRLRFLAGLLHDAGKSRYNWQEYIRGRGKGVPHAFAGAMLFAVCLDELIKKWDLKLKEKQALLHLGVGLVHFLYEHHGEIPDINDCYPPWTGGFVPSDLKECDLEGIFTLVRKYFPELDEKRFSFTALDERLQEINLRWKNWFQNAWRHVDRLLESGNRYAVGARLCLQRENARLIAADRFHAAGVRVDELPEEYISPGLARQVQARIEQFCSDRKQVLTAAGADRLLLGAREKWRRKAVEAFAREWGNGVFTLELPTGYGKTLTSLSIALKAIELGLCRRIVYVAPYISILSQAATEIQGSTGLNVMTHHHISTLQRLMEEERDEDVLLESWRAPVVATTFNQLFRALFPSRAQHTLRLHGLKDSFVIVDEPQIISAGVWNLFLALMEATTAELNTKVLLTTATLPELEGGIFNSAVSLGKAEVVIARFSVEVRGEGDEEYLAREAVEAYKDYGSVAVICNTVKDAAEVYRWLIKLVPGETVYFLSGRLTPLHKKARIEEIRQALKNGSRALVVCTQVLEAGVDLSFRVVFRALPVIPSVVQAAGRCNRHGEGETGRLYVLNLLRGGETDTRNYVYRDPDQREVTDKCLTNYPVFSEDEASRVVREFYRECFRRNTHQAVLEKILEAASGYYSAPANVHPFGPEVPGYGIFVPRWWGEPPEIIKTALRKFHISRPDEIWELYASKDFLRSLSFMERKAFMGLMNHFVVQVPAEVAQEIGEPASNRSLLRLRYDSRYRDDTGLSVVDMKDEHEAWFI